MSNLYLISQGLWHKIDIANTSKLVCGEDVPEKSEPALQSRPTICPGCEREFPTASLISTHMTNLRIWKTAIACATTEEKREEIMKFHKLSVDAAHALGMAQARLEYESFKPKT